MTNAGAGLALLALAAAAAPPTDAQLARMAAFEERLDWVVISAVTPVLIGDPQKSDVHPDATCAGYRALDPALRAMKSRYLAEWNRLAAQTLRLIAPSSALAAAVARPAEGLPIGYMEQMDRSLRTSAASIIEAATAEALTATTTAMRQADTSGNPEQRMAEIVKGARAGSHPCGPLFP